MSWNYRIVEYANGSGFGLHAVFYGADGEAMKMSDRPTGFAGETPEEVRSDLIVAKMDATRRPVFKEPDGWVN